MIGALVSRALELSAVWWLTMTALVIVTGSLLVWWLAAYGTEWDREHDGR